MSDESFLFLCLDRLDIPVSLARQINTLFTFQNVLFVYKKEKEKKNTKTYFPKVLIVSVTLCIEE